MDTVVYTIDENCRCCNKCIHTCPVINANVSDVVNGESKTHIDGEACIMCGKCIEVCTHEARDFKDDTERFISDLRRGVGIPIIAEEIHRLQPQKC